MTTTKQNEQPKPRYKQSNAFKQGYYCAVANIIHTHGADVIALDVLRNYGEIDFTGIDEYEIEVLKPIASEIERRCEAKACLHRRFDKLRSENTPLKLLRVVNMSGIESH